MDVLPQIESTLSRPVVEPVETAPAVSFQSASRFHTLGRKIGSSYIVLPQKNTAPKKKKPMVDFHIHSTCSDGTLAPAAIVEEAVVRRLAVVALSDHDTTDGIAPFKARAVELDIAAIASVEISAEAPNPQSECHILGPGVVPGLASLEGALEKIRAGRGERNGEIVRRLNRLGLELTIKEVIAEAGGGVIARPHFAAVLIRKGYCTTPQEAFDRWLGKGGAAYEERFRLSAHDSLAMLREAGALPVLAHPVKLKMPPQELERYIASLKESGLAGIEVFHPSVNPELEGLFGGIAKRLGLFAAGGSDYHGANKPERKLGEYHVGVPIPLSCAEFARSAGWLQS